MKTARWLLLLIFVLAGAAGTGRRWLRPAPAALHGAVPVLHKTPRPVDGPKTVRRVPGRYAAA